jgi:hypothetical protein
LHPPPPQNKLHRSNPPKEGSVKTVGQLEHVCGMYLVKIKELTEKKEASAFTILDSKLFAMF